MRKLQVVERSEHFLKKLSYTQYLIKCKGEKLVKEGKDFNFGS